MYIGVQNPGLGILTGESIGISEYTDFKWNDLIWYWYNPEEIDNPCIGKWLGISQQVRSELCHWILTDEGTIFPNVTVQHVKIDETKDPDISEKVKYYI